MANNTVNFSINIDGNAYKGIVQIDDALKKVTADVKSNLSFMEKFGGAALKFNMISDSISKIRDVLQSVIQPGIQLNTSLQDLSAITGVTGDGLKEIEGYARQTAKTFGGDAAQAVESYKLVLSQLSPEIAKTPEALQAMGTSIATLSKTMGGDTTAAAEVLTTAMNQFQVSTADPIAASAEMTRMMNVMAAAAKEGSAELPQIKQALEQAGMASNAANVSFEETNAAIQVLDKAGKKGSEGGIALRNVMNILARGRFLPEKIQEELQTAGVDMATLTDKTRSLTERLRPLQTVLGDSALFSKLFGMENTNAAMALVQGIDEVGRMTEAIEGTNTAYEQAQTVMESYAEKQARINARFDDLKISVFNLTGDFGIWTDVVASSLVPIAQLAPIFAGIGSAITFCKGHWGGFVKSIRIGVLQVGLRLGILKYSIASAGGMFKFLQLTAQSACLGISTAIMNIPILGWIAAFISLVIAGIKLLWEKSEGFRRVVFGVFEAIGAVFHNIWVVVKTVFGFIWERMKNTLGARRQFHDLYDGVTGVFSAIGDFFSSIWSWISDTVGNSIGWIWEKLSAVVGWIHDNLIAPIMDAFTNLWDIIRGIFDKILGYINKLFEPIKKLWNKLFPSDKFKDVAAAYKDGAEKGSESWRKDHDAPSDGTSILGQEPGKGTPVLNRPGAGLNGGNLGASAGASAGKAQQINITLKSMVENMTFNGGMRENARDVEAQLREMMARILGMAETAV